MIELIRSQRNEYQPIPKKTKTYFKIIEGMLRSKDKEITKKLIRNSNRGNFLEFMNCFEELKATRRDKEYFVRLRFYSDLNSNVGILNSICIKSNDGEEIISNDQNVINKIVYEKYSKLFNSTDDRVKLINSPSVFMYTETMIIEALKSINLNKATSWDCIPGISYKNILKDQKLIKAMTVFINSLITHDDIPNEIALGRLFCLNKNCNEPGNEKSIRPIVIMSMIIKIIEYPLNLELKKVKLSQAQLGFREKLSTELNILRLRSRLHSLQYNNYDRKKKLPKRYILLVDLSEAFDRVNHQLLVDKMIKKNVITPVVNILIKLLNSGCISIDKNRIIKVKSGVGQGKICSPLEFNIYIDDLLESLSTICHTCLGFADDTAYICRDLSELHKTIEIIEKWTIENKIPINRKKSGILIINDDGVDSNLIKDIPVVTEYNYLGVLIDNKLKPGFHVTKIKKKIKIYLSKNKMLQQKYFTPFSLIRIIEYFVKSRLSYGISCFLEVKTQINRIDLILLQHIKSLFGLLINTSHKRLQLTLGEPEIRIRLAIRLLKNWYKYHDHFHEYPEKMRSTLELYFSTIELSSPCDYNKLKSKLIHENLIKIGNELKEDIKIRYDHRKFLRSYVFTYPDKRDFLVIRFFTKTTRSTNERLFEICQCGMENSGRHAVDVCELTMTRKEREEYRSIYINESGGILNLSHTLFDMLKITFFTAEGSLKKNCIRKIVELMKIIIMKTIIINNNEKKDQKSVEQSHENDFHE